MGTRRRTALALICALALIGLVVPASTARATAVPKVSGLAAAGSYLSSAKLGVKWKRITGASYQVRWAASTGALSKAKVYPTTKTSAISPVLGNPCSTYYAQVRAKKSGKFGAWSTAKALKFSGTSGVPAAKPITSGQTSTTAAQLRWTKTPGAAGYRAHYSPAPNGNWPGYFPYTATTPYTSSGLSIALPTAPALSDHFMGVEYGNPVFAQLETKRCSGTYAKAPFTAVFPKPLPPGDATTGSPLRFGAYNVELAPQAGNPRIPVLAQNIANANVDVIALQETNSGTAAALQDALVSLGQTDWASYGLSQQFVMWRTSKWTSVSTNDIGQPVDGVAGIPSDAAKTPLPSPGVHLTPAVADPTLKDIFVASVHLEDRRKFQASATNAQQKQDAQDAVLSLLAAIATANPTDLPTLVAGDLKGIFGGGGQPETTGYCDESSIPFCPGEGQPTFIRNGYIDARGAVTKVGIQYGTVNGGAAPQLAANSGVASRADFIVVKGFTGTSKFANVANTSNVKAPSDHNLIYADFFIPFAP